MWLLLLVGCATKAPPAPAAAPSPDSVNALHADWLARHPGTQVSVCRGERIDGPRVVRTIRTPTGQRSWEGDAPGPVEVVEPAWGYGSIFYDSLRADPRWRTSFQGDEAEPEVRPVEGTLEPLPALPELAEGCIHTALPDAPVWLRLVTTPDGQEEVLGRPPRFPSDHGLGEPIRTQEKPHLLEFWITPVDPEVFRTLGLGEEHRFQGPRYPYSHHPFIADWDQLDTAYEVLGAPSVRALGRAYIGERDLYFLLPEDPDAVWAELGPYQDAPIPCDFASGGFLSGPCVPWRFARRGDWIVAGEGAEPLEGLAPGGEAWWEASTVKATFHRRDADPLEFYRYGSVRIHEVDGWWVVTAK